MSTSYDNIEKPKIIIHSPCNNDLFYYFGLAKDVFLRPDIDNLMDFDGCKVTEKNIICCKFCGEPLRQKDLNVYDSRDDILLTYDRAINKSYYSVDMYYLDVDKIIMSKELEMNKEQKEALNRKLELMQKEALNRKLELMLMNSLLNVSAVSKKT